MGNICRSPLAHGIFRDLINKAGLEENFHVESSGTISYHTGELPDNRMRAEAARHGIRLDHKARQISKTDLNDFDLILAMDSTNMQNILKLKDNTAADTADIKMFRSYDPEGGTDVPDPYYGGLSGFSDVYEIVERTCKNLLIQIQKEYPDYFNI